MTTLLIGLAIRQAGRDVDFIPELVAIALLGLLGGPALRRSILATRLDRTTRFFLTAAAGMPLCFCAIFVMAVTEFGLHGVLGTNHAFNWPVYLAEHLLLLMPGLAAGASLLVWAAPAGPPPVAEASSDIEARLRADWWEWFWLQPLLLADIAVISSIILGAGTLARRLSAWFGVNLIVLSAVQLLAWLAMRRLGWRPSFPGAVILIGLPFLNWARLPILQEHGPEAVGGAVGMWTLALLCAIAISARHLLPMVTVVCLSTASIAIAYFNHQHADAWFEQALISILSGAFCIALVFTLHGRARQNVRDQSILAQALRREQEASEAAQRETLRRHRVLRAVGHDLRQPLSALQLWLFAAERKTPAMQADLAAASSAVSSAHEILDSIAQITWLNDAEKEPKFRNVPLARLLTDLAAELKLNARDAGVTLRCEPLAVTVRSDPLLLRRILRNFLVNAVKYGRDDVVLTATRAGGHARISVVDNGAGIPAELQASIFEEFGRGTREDGDGFGVGLAVARDLSSALGHELFLESGAGKGSTFGVLVPISGSGAPGRAPRRDRDRTDAEDML